MRQIPKALFAFLMALLSFGPAVAQSFDQGLAAYQRGNYQAALRLLRPVAEQGNKNAAAILGLIYRTSPVHQDFSEAVKWFRLAALQGHPNGQFGLGELYQRGLGVPLNMPEAYKWYRLAAMQSLAEAFGSIGKMFMNGSGLPKNSVYALSLFYIAGDAASESRSQLEPIMNPADRLVASAIGRACVLKMQGCQALPADPQEARAAPLRSARDVLTVALKVPVTSDNVVPPSPVDRSVFESKFYCDTRRNPCDGDYVLSIEVLEDGKAGSVAILDVLGTNGKASNTRAALQKRTSSGEIRFSPGTIDGRPVKMWLDAHFEASQSSLSGKNFYLGQISYRLICFSHPMIGASIPHPLIDGGRVLAAAPGKPTGAAVDKWVHVSSSGNVDDIIIKSSNGWRHFNEPMIVAERQTEIMVAAVQQIRKLNSQSCWFDERVYVS